MSIPVIKTHAKVLIFTFFVDSVLFSFTAQRLIGSRHCSLQLNLPHVDFNKNLPFDLILVWN